MDKLLNQKNVEIQFILPGMLTCVVYFNQCLNAAHSKCWSKYVFLFVLCKKAEKGRKSKKFEANFFEKYVFKFASKLWQKLSTSIDVE